jgi:tetratricopeptide (TPR) repeat protein
MKRIGLSLALALLFFSGCARTPEAKEARFLANGKKHMEKKDYPRAVLEFKNAARAMPKDAEPYYQLGLASLASGDLKMAVAALRKATELSPKHTGAQLKLAELMASSRDASILEEAKKRAEEVLAVSPASIDALDVLALAEWKLGDPEAAEHHLDQALQKFPQSLKSSVALARVKLSTKDLAGAEEVLKKAAQQAPKSADPQVALGEFYVLLRKPPEAEKQFRNALQIDAKNAMALLGLAGLQIRSNRNGEAESTLARLSALPDKRYRHLHAVYLFESGKRDPAIAEFEKLAKEDQNDRAARTRLVAAYLAVNRVPDAEKVLAAALRKNAKDTDALLQRAAIYLRTAKYTEAQQDLNNIVRLQPNSADAHYLLSRVHRARGLGLSQRQELAEAVRLNPNRLPVRIELAQLLIATKGAKSALDLMNEAPAAQKKSLAFITQRNWALLGAGDGAELRKGIDEGIRLARSPELLLQDGILKLVEKNYAAARSSLEESLKQNPEDVRALDALARTYSAQKQSAAGLQKVQEYASKRPKSAPLQHFLGLSLLAAGKRAEARAAFAAAKAANPKFTPADLALAQLDLSEKKYDSARKTLETLLASNDHDSVVHVMLGDLEEQTGHFTAAVEHYRKALDITPDNVLALNNLAYTLANYTNQADEALKYAERAKELAPDNPAVENTLGWVLYRKGLYTEALPHLALAVQKDGTARRKYHLAMAYFKVGERQRAQQNLENALAMDPNLPEAKAAQQVAQASGGQR